MSVGDSGCVIGLVGASLVESFYRFLSKKTKTMRGMTHDLAYREVDGGLMQDVDENCNSSDCSTQKGDVVSLINVFLLGGVTGLVSSRLVGLYLTGWAESIHNWSILYGGLIGGTMSGSLIFSHYQNDQQTLAQIWLISFMYIYSRTRYPKKEIPVLSQALFRYHQVLRVLFGCSDSEWVFPPEQHRSK